jgi:hypothetical protein
MIVTPWFALGNRAGTANAVWRSCERRRDEWYVVRVEGNMSCDQSQLYDRAERLLFRVTEVFARAVQELIDGAE